jgi:hypothetical protein
MKAKPRNTHWSSLATGLFSSLTASRSTPVRYRVMLALIGIEITAPAATALDRVNAVLQEHRLPLLTSQELSPLQAA